MLPSGFSRQELKGLAEEAKRVKGAEQDKSVRLPLEEMSRLSLLQQRNRDIYARQLQNVRAILLFLENW